MWQHFSSNSAPLWEPLSTNVVHIPHWEHSLWFYVPSQQVPPVTAPFANRPAASEIAKQDSQQPRLRARWKLRNAKIRRSSQILKAGARFRLRNAKYQPPKLKECNALDDSHSHGGLLLEHAAPLATEEAIWKVDASTDDVKDASTVASDDASGCERDDLCESEVEHEATTAANFNGKWSRAHIYNGVLSWNEGEDVQILPLSATSFQICYFDSVHPHATRVYQAELDTDACLHWDDGDMWCRGKTDLDGSWGPASIHGNILRWKEGEDVQILLLSATSFQMRYFDHAHPPSERVYQAELRADGQLHWDDGDIWTRKVAKLKRELPPWLAGKQQSQRIGQKHTVDEENVPKMKLCASTQISEAFQGLPEKETKEKTANQVIGAEFAQESRDTAADKSAFVGGGRTEESNATAQVPRVESAKVRRDTEAIESAFTKGGRAKESKAITLTAIDNKLHTGHVKSWKGTRGWIFCQSASELFPNQDVMVHKNDCDFRLKAGDEVEFKLATNYWGGPQAVNVARPPARVDAKDYFRSRDVERKRSLIN
mmetsp:Transcript_19185/g.35168  ORF Transcript_19185/g.35168 Transcript_19185/m.35168 type:complete len:543 (+) Transcript_19185:39-1667(+)